MRSLERRVTWLGWALRSVAALAMLTLRLGGNAGAQQPAADAQAEYATIIQPLLKTYCLKCRAAEVQKGSLDLERFASLDLVRKDLAAAVRATHAHPNGGNGVTRWSEHRRAGRATVPGEGAVDLGKKTKPRARWLKVEQGDVLAVDARDRNHSCDVTEAAPTVTASNNPERLWDHLAADVTDNLLNGDPHADQHENADTWSFVRGASKSAASATTFRQPDAKAHPNLFVRTDTCNVYVLRDGDAALLIDVGDGSALGHLTEIGVKRVEWVLFTHHHREQCQGVDRVDRNTTKVAAPKAEQALFETPTEFRKWFPKLGDTFSVYGASYVRPPATAIPLDQTLESGKVFKWRDFEIECLDTPGHSPGSMTYVIRENGKSVALTGGVVHAGGKMTTWFDTEWDYGFAKGIDTLVASVELLIDQRLDLVLPSQGPAIRNPQAQLETYRNKLVAFRQSYIRGYSVFDSTEQDRDSISTPTKVPLISQVTPHLYKLSHKTQGKNFAIIVSDRGHGLILDAGLFPESMLDEIIVGMREHLGLKQIDAFWISHMHGDHFLLGPTLKRKYGAQAWTLDRIADQCEHPRRYDYAALVQAYGDGFDGMKIDKPFRDGETVEWEGYKIQVDWMPGQTEFGCCLWLELDGKRIAFTGDNLFGNPADPRQDGHEAVVARNSAIFEEGYLLGSRYLKDLKPDIVMGSHSYVMHDPAAFLVRYHEWSKRIITLYKDLLPDKDYEYLFDPYWVSAYPYRVDFGQHDVQQVTVTVRNFRDAPQRHRIKLTLPPGVTAEPAVLEGTVDRESRQRFPVKLTIDRDAVSRGVQIVPFDITLDGKHYGELFDFLMRTDTTGNK